MPSFVYTARDEAGTSVSGTLAGENTADITRQLRAAGRYPISIKPATAEACDARGGAGVRVSRNEVIQIAQQLAIMVETGVTLAEALDCVANQAVKPNVKRLLRDLTAQVQAGGDFSTALARHPKSFPRIFTALIKAAEKSGMMSKLMNRGTQYLRDEQETLRKVRGALIYPCIMLSFALSTTLFLLTFVLPKFTVIYAAKKAALPTPTKVLIALSSFLVDHWLLLLSAAAGLTLSFFLTLSTRGGKRGWDTIQLGLPLIGGIYRKLHLSRGLRMIGTMAGAGVNLVDCVATAQQLCGNVRFEEMWADVTAKITAGRQMSEPLSASNLVPKPVAQMISSAERSGKLAQVTEQVATFSEQELKEKITELTRYIEPAMIVLMGIVIGSIALALMLPIFTISRVMAQ